MRVLFWVFPLVLASAGCGSSSSTGGNDKKQVSNHEQPGDENGDLGLGSKGGSADPGDAGSPLTNSGGSGGTASGGVACAGWSTSVARVDVGDTDDTMSAVRAREALELGFAPSPDRIRADDFFNYYSSGFAPSDELSPVLGLELRERAVPAEYDLLVTLRAPAPVRPRSVFTVVVDTTPSMAGIPLARAQMVVKALGDALQPGDALRILTTDATQGFKAFALTGQPGELEDASAWLKTSNDGDLHEALTQAYDAADASHDPAAANRVVLVTDGAEPIASLPSSLIDSHASSGTRLVGIGLGPTTTFRDGLLREATKVGRGAYAYVDNEGEAQSLFKSRFDRLFGVVYDDLRVVVSLPPFLRQVVSSASQIPGGESVPRALPAGATLRWLVRLESCSAVAYKSYLGTQLTATADFVDPITQQALPSVTGSVDSKPLPLATPLPALDKALATKAYVEALQSVNKPRVLAALAAVEKAQGTDTAAVSPDPDLVEMAKLLKEHPAAKLP